MKITQVLCIGLMIGQMPCIHSMQPYRYNAWDMQKIKIMQSLNTMSRKALKREMKKISQQCITIDTDPNDGQKEIDFNLPEEAKKRFAVVRTIFDDANALDAEIRQNLKYVRDGGMDKEDNTPVASHVYLVGGNRHNIRVWQKACTENINNPCLEARLRLLQCGHRLALFEYLAKKPGSREWFAKNLWYDRTHVQRAAVVTAAIAATGALAGGAYYLCKKFGPAVTAKLKTVVNKIKKTTVK